VEQAAEELRVRQLLAQQLVLERKQQQQAREQKEQEQRAREHLEQQRLERARRVREQQRARQQLEEEQRASQQFEDDLFGGGPPREVPSDLVRKWTNGFSDDRKIGEGAFGNVYEGVLEDRQNQRQARVAVKRLKPEIRLQGDEIEQSAALSCIRREIHVLSTFYHPNIIRLLGYTCTSAGVTPDSELCLVYELGHASLDKMLAEEERAADLSCKARVRIAADVRLP